MVAEHHELVQQCQRQVHAQQRESSDRLKKLEDDMSQIRDVFRPFAERTEGALARLVPESAEELDTRCLKMHSKTGA